MRRFASAAVVLWVVGCSQSGPDHDSTADRHAPTASSSQRKAFDALESTTGSSWTWLEDPARATPMHLSSQRDGASLLSKSDDVVARTIAILEEHKALFRMRSPARELSTESTSVDALGMTHARFQQVTHGVPVAGAEIFVHYDAAGRLVSIDGDYVADLDGLRVEPALTAEGARAAVQAALVAADPGLDVATVEWAPAELVVYAPRGRASASLAYRVTARALLGERPAIWVTEVDALGGAILHTIDKLQTVQGQGVGALGDAKAIEVSANGALFEMIDASAGVQIRTYTARNQATNELGTLVTSATVSSWDTNVIGAGAAVDAHFNAGAVFRYYRDRHGRSGIDGAGSAMLSTAHFGNRFDNAAWDGQRMLYGDGGLLFRPLAAGLDIVAHEFTHGVTETTSRLAYELQPGALNEAVSDIFGAFIEHAVTPDPAKNWQIGEKVVRGATALRDMKAPGAVSSPQPAHMSQYVNTQSDNGGIHTNSGIINNAAYLMTVGGTNPVSNVEVKVGIGWEKSEKLWYRANATYFKQTTSFAQAAQGVLEAAKDLTFTANEVAIVECAFKATGILQGTCASIASPSPSADPGATPGAAAPGAPGGGSGTVAGPQPGAPDDAESSHETQSAPLPETRRRAITTEKSACSMGASSTGQGSAAFWLLGITVAALGGRVRRRSPSPR